jgi:hypothetical protein
LNELTSQRLTVADYDELLDTIDERQWGDGLPIVPPTEDRVRRFVLASGRPPGHVIGTVPPIWAPLTIEKLAINAVMAGCRPQYMRVLITAMIAMLEDQFNLHSVQTTTHCAAPLVLVSGPEVPRIGLNYGYGALGPGYRSNAAIGRAVRLILLNVGGARPGDQDRSTYGGPAKYTFCVAENEVDSPWASYRSRMGYADSATTVTVAALESPHNVHDAGSTTGVDLLTTIAGTMATAGVNNLCLGGSDPFLLLGPEHAQQIAADGLGVEDVRRFLFEHARTPVDRIGKGLVKTLRERHRLNPLYHELGLDRSDLDLIPVVGSPAELNVLVVGGPGRHSAWLPSMASASRSVTRLLDD